MAGPPELDVAAIRAYCEQRVPPHAGYDVRIEVELEGNAVTIVDRRPPWRPDLGPEWTTSPVARLRCVVRDQKWTLQRRDRNGRWHRYAGIGASSNVTVLLNERSGPDRELLGLTGAKPSSTCDRRRFGSAGW